MEVGNAPGQKVPAMLGGNKTVFHELKLSEILLADIDVYKEEINNQKELAQRQQSDYDNMKKKMTESNRIIKKLKLF